MIMKKSMLVGTVFGIGIATTVAGVAGYNMFNKSDSSLVVAEQNCYDVEVENAADPRDEKRIAGTVVGALVGGAVGNDIGDRDLTTAAGAAVGAIAGNKAQEAFQDDRTTTATERRCDPVR
jgi:uncharacterized protein YcfJ